MGRQRQAGLQFGSPGALMVYGMWNLWGQCIWMGWSVSAFEILLMSYALYLWMSPPPKPTQHRPYRPVNMRVHRPYEPAIRVNNQHISPNQIHEHHVRPRRNTTESTESF